MVSSNALRSARTRSAGTSGAVRTGRPTAASPETTSRICRCSSFCASSVRSGGPGRSFSRCGPTWNRMLTLPSLIQCGIVGLQRRPGVAAATIHLAPLERDHDVAAAGIAGHDLELRAEQIVGDRRIEHRWRARAGGADRKRALLRVVDGAHADFGPGDHDVVDRHHVADPVEIAHVELDAGLAERLVGRRCLAEHGEDGAVLRRDLVEPVRGAAAAGARHVLRDHGRLAGNLLAEEAREQLGIDVVAAAGTIADDQPHGLAAIELGDVVRLRRCAGGADSQHSRKGCKGPKHHKPPITVTAGNRPRSKT